MKKQIPILIALAMITIGIISSCKKDPDPNNNGQNNDTIPTVTDGIHFGDTTGMIVTTYNTIMEFDENWHSFVLDLNGNGIDDIKIETIYDGPLAIGEFQTLTLYCLNRQTEILADSVIKESYSHSETIIDTTNDYIITSRDYVYSTCEKTTEGDLVHTSKVFEVFANDYNDPYNVDNPFLSGDVALFKEDVSYSLADPDEVNHTISISSNKYIYSCWNFPTDEEKYIGFKFTTNGKSRLGWLKLKLHSIGKGSVVNTELFETAIQK